MSAINLPITALRFAGQGLGLAGRGAMEAARFGGRTMISPGIIGSLARWTAASMVLSSLPNPAARKHAIDRALHEANREAEREYMSLKEDMKRNHQLHKREREFQYTQRIADARFLANPEERNFERRMAELDKKYDETLQKIDEGMLQKQQDTDEAFRLMMSRRDVSFHKRAGEWGSNLERGIGDLGVAGIREVARFTDLLTSAITLGQSGTNLYGNPGDWEKRSWGRTTTFAVPNELQGDLEGTSFRLANGAKATVKSGELIVLEKIHGDAERLHVQVQRAADHIVKQREDAKIKFTQERLANEKRLETMKLTEQHLLKNNQLGFMDIETHSVIQGAQLDAVINSRFASPEQKLMARLDKELLFRQTAIAQEFNGKRNEMVEAKQGVSEEEQKDLDHKYRQLNQDDLNKTKKGYFAANQKTDDDFIDDDAFQQFGERRAQRQQDMQKELKELQDHYKSLPNHSFDTDLEQEKAQNVIKQHYANRNAHDFRETRKDYFSANNLTEEDFETSEANQQFKKREAQREKDKRKELEKLRNRPVYLEATDSEYAEIDQRYDRRQNELAERAQKQAEENARGEVAESLNDLEQSRQQNKAAATAKGQDNGGFWNWFSEVREDNANDLDKIDQLYDSMAKQRINEIQNRHLQNIKNSDEFQDELKTLREDRAQEHGDLHTRRLKRQRGDIESGALDAQEAVQKNRIVLEIQERKQAIQAAFQLPVRSSLEESYNMVNDELIKTGEAKRLGGADAEMIKALEQTLAPSLEKLDQHAEKLELILKSGEVKVEIQGGVPLM